MALARSTADVYVVVCADAHVQAGCSREPVWGMQDTPVCWICLDTERPHRHLVQPCACPRFAHAHCLARWQLQSAGSR